MIIIDTQKEIPPNAAPYVKQYETYCHLMSDKNVEELHEFAKKIRLQQSWFQDTTYPHYDLLGIKKRLQAIARGAVEVTDREQLRRCAHMRRNIIYEEKHELVGRHCNLPGSSTNINIGEIIAVAKVLNWTVLKIQYDNPDEIRYITLDAVVLL